ncbi:MAG: cytochrome P450 [Planctomycetota bacterium]|jgi:cytochrome P450
MSLSSWFMRTVRQMGGDNPFAGGDIVPSRMALIGTGRPSLPFPHLWNFREPIRILDAYWCEHELAGLQGSARHNRFLEVPGLPPVLVTREPAVIRAILSATGDKPGQFDRDTAPSTGIAAATGEDTLLYANGPLWRRQKKLVAPSFSRGNLFEIENFHGFEATFRRTVAERIALLQQAQAERGEQVTRIELEAEISAVMLEMLVNNFFGAAVGYEELRHRYVPAIALLINAMVTETIAPRLRRFYRRFAGTDPAHGPARDAFEELTDIALSGRATGAGLWSEFQSDAPDALLRSNIRVFLAGALEATTSFASWAITHLARTPELQDRIHDEVIGIEHYEPENLQQAEALKYALEETLRLTPSLYFLPRRATVATRIETTDGRAMVIPAGTHVVLDVWHANRCEEFWGVAETGYPAGEFHPDRWRVLAERGRSLKDSLHFGFGYGPRVCPGKFLGQLEVGLVVGAFVRMFRFSTPTPPEPHTTATPVRAGVSTKPADGVLVDLEVRDPEGLAARLANA